MVRFIAGALVAGSALWALPASGCDQTGCRTAKTVRLPPHMVRHLLRAPERPLQLAPEAAQAYALHATTGVRVVASDELNEIDLAAPALASDSAARIVALRFVGVRSSDAVPVHDRRSPSDISAASTTAMPPAARAAWAETIWRWVVVPLKRAAIAASAATSQLIAAIL